MLGLGKCGDLVKDGGAEHTAPSNAGFLTWFCGSWQRIIIVGYSAQNTVGGGTAPMSERPLTRRRQHRKTLKLSRPRSRCTDYLSVSFCSEFFGLFFIPTYKVGFSTFNLVLRREKNEYFLYKIQ